MKRLLFLGACLVALASQPVMAQTVEPDVVVVKVRENDGVYLEITIARGAGKLETRLFKQHDLRDGAGAELTRQALAQLYQEGYTLTSTYGGGDRYINSSTLVFTKSH
jgi:hypothetical protein